MDRTERLELKISLGDRDVVVRGDPDHTVDDLLKASVGAAPSNGDALWCERRNLSLDERSKLSRAGIRWGDRLRLSPRMAEPTHVGGQATAELEVTSGPCAGKRWLLAPGEYKLGRSPDADIYIEDQSLSREHLRVAVGESRVAITDVGSANGTAIEGKAIATDTPTLLGRTDDLELGRTMVRVRTLTPPQSFPVEQRGGRLFLNRPPRVAQPFHSFSEELPAPPGRARKIRLPIVTSIIPVIAGVALFLIMKSPTMLAFCALSPLMAVGTFVSDKLDTRKSFGRNSGEFRQRLNAAVSKLDTALVEEAARRRAASPDAAEVLTRIRELRSTLWERRPDDSDFLLLRVGVADMPAQSTVSYANGGDEELRAWADDMLGSRATVPSVPVTVDVAASGVVGVAGPTRLREGLVRWLVLQAAALHSPGELVIAAALPLGAEDDWDWLKWLPHLRGERLGLTHSVALGTQASEQLLGSVGGLVAERQDNLHSDRDRRGPHLLLIVDDDTEVDRSLVSSAFSDCIAAHVSVIWMGHDRHGLPGLTSVILELHDSPSVATVVGARTGRTVQEVSIEAVAVDIVADAARQLAPLVDRGELVGAGEIPQALGLLDLLDLSPPRPETLGARWEAWTGALSATIGAGAGGEVAVDIRSDGPHALIAGTTGSGKSELLRTFVAAAAANVPPNRLTFLLVDYKGGSAFAPCRELPHVLDVVSDLDEHLAERALIALRAELKRRETLLAQFGMRDLLEIQRRNPDQAPPVLIIMVDEFAKLREEVPEFVDGVVDIAQRGRSLGVHMVLAAQTLRNALTPAIRANTNLRIALRVADETESVDVIDSPLAARIPSGPKSRGRAFLRTGHSELREFQAAYVSGKTEFSEDRAVEVSSFPLDAATAATTGPRSSAPSDSDDDNDLTALGAAATDAQQRLGLAVPTAPWLPVLPPLLNRVAVTAAAGHDLGIGTIAVGLVDVPHAQRQDALLLDLPAVGNVAVFGAGRSGKTTLLVSAALALARSGSPQDVRIYAIDAGGNGLAGLSNLPHLGGIARASDEELVERLLRSLTERIERSQRGATNQGPLTLLLLDDVDAFTHYYDRPGHGSPIEQLQRILSGGHAARIHVVLTAVRRGALSSTMAAQIGQRLALRMPTEDDLIALGLDVKAVRGARLPPGRGFTQDSLEFQIAVDADGDAVAPVAKVVGELAAATDERAPQLAVLATDLALDGLSRPTGLNAVPIGISDRELEPVTIDLAETHFLAVGPYRSGRSTSLATIAVQARASGAPVKLLLLTPRRSPLLNLGIWDMKAAGGDECKHLLAGIVEQLLAGSLEPSLLFVDDGGDLNDSVTMASLEQAVRRGRDAALSVVAALETSAARAVGVPWVRELRKEQHGLLLQPNLMTDGDILGAALPRRVAAPRVPGRGFLVVRGAVDLVQLAH